MALGSAGSQHNRDSVRILLYCGWLDNACSRPLFGVLGDFDQRSR